MPRTPRAARTRSGVAVIALVGVLGAVLARLGGRPIDLEVYRTAGAVWRAGQPLYRDGYPYGLGVYLPFTYPPVAALVLGLTSLLPSPVSLGVVSAGSLLALAATSYLAGHRARLTRPWEQVPLTVTAALAALAVVVEPVRLTLFFGQVNLVLMALVTADLLVLNPRRARWPRWPPGLLIGIAAAVKLTPLVFLVVLLCRRQWRACATALVTFVAAHLVGAVLLPRDSRDYWLGGVLTAPGRIGSADTATNESLRGVLARAWPDAPSLVWLGLVAVTGALTVLATWRRTRRGDDLGALLSAAVGGLLVSPVSWTHHWVWVVPALVWLAARARADSQTGHRGPAAAATTSAPVTGTAPVWSAARAQLVWWRPAVVALVFVVAPAHFLPSGGGREQHWAVWQQLVGGTYVWLGLAALVAGAMGGSRPARRRHRATDTTTTSSVASAQAVVGRPGTRTPR